MMINLAEVPEFYQPYLQILAGSDKSIVHLMGELKKEFFDLLSPLEDKIYSFRYAPDKWSVKDLTLHITDAERVFSYRALRFARNDQTVLSGFEHDRYVQEANATSRSPQSLLNDFLSVRMASIHLFESFDKKILERKGKSSGNTLSVKNIGYIICGHQKHHMEVLKKHYLK